MTGIADMELRKVGYLEKYSVGRGIIPLKNWQKRWFTVDHSGLNYSKAPTEPSSRRTYIPFVAGPGGLGDVLLAPVFLYPSVTTSIHPEATDASCFYFALRFHERGTPRLLLLRTTDAKERDGWVRFLSLFVHAAALSGPQLSITAAKRGIDPDELDPREKVVLKQAIMDWDEGCHLRASGSAVPVQAAPNSLDDCTVWHSDDDVVSGQQSRRGSKSNGQTPTSQSPRRPPNSPPQKPSDYDCL